jgi:hypothetical protein
MPRTKYQKGLILIAVTTLILGVAGVASAAFQDVEVSPRARGMGMSFVAAGPDAYAPFHNPASLPWATDIEGAGSYTRPFGYDFSSQSVVSGIAPIGRWGGVGIGVRRFAVEYLGEDLTGETTVSLAHGFRVLDDLQSTVAAGWSVNLYSLDYGTSVSGLDPGSATTVGVNLSAQAVVHERTRVGFYALNVNNPSIGKIDHEELVRQIGAGVSYSPYRGVTTVLDITNQLGDAVQFRGGTEFEVTKFLWLRAGLRTEPNIFTAGMGVSHYGITLDYAFSTGGGTLDTTHQFGISYVLPSGK